MVRIKHLTFANSSCRGSPSPGISILGLGLEVEEGFDVDDDVELDGDDVVEHGDVEVIMLNTSSSS